MRVRRDRTLDQIERLHEERLDHFVRVARAITGDRERAREAVQDAFASLIKSRGTSAATRRSRRSSGASS